MENTRAIEAIAYDMGMQGFYLQLMKSSNIGVQEKEAITHAWFARKNPHIEDIRKHAKGAL